MSVAVSTASAAGSEPPSFGRIYREHNGFVWQALRSFGVPEPSVDDAVQDVFFVVYRRLREFECRAAIRTWLYEIVRRVAWRYRARAQRDALATDALPELQSADDLDAAVDRTLAFDVLCKFTDTLDEDRLRVFVLSEFGDLSGRDIAEALEVNLNTVYSRLRSAHQDLDRLASRLRAREANSLLFSARGSRPSGASVRRTWAALVVRVGAAQPAAIATMAGWLSQLGWVGVGGVATGLGIAAAVALSATLTAPPPTSASTARSSLAAERPAPPGVRRSAEPPMNVEASPSPVPEVRPPASTQTPTERPQAATTPSPNAASEDAAESRLADEVALVRRLRDRMGHRSEFEPLLTTYRAQFAHGTLQEEVEALSIEHRCAARQNVAPRIEAFARRWPRSALLKRLEKSCGEQFGPQRPAAVQTQPS